MSVAVPLLMLLSLPLIGGEAALDGETGNDHIKAGNDHIKKSHSSEKNSLNPRSFQPISPASKDDISKGYFIPPRPLEIAQMRIQKRIVIRVPLRQALRAAPMSDVRPKVVKPRFKEKKIGKCVAMNQILAVQYFSGRDLDLFTRGRQMVRARLEKKCQARSFYSGFYMEKSKDGKICTDRDILRSRTGAKCEINRFRLLVPE